MSEEEKSHPNESELNDNQIQEIHDELLSEKDIPEEGFSFLPIVLIFLFAGICFWGGIYIVNHGGEFRWDAYDPEFVSSHEPLKIPEKSLFEIGQKIYINQCAQCHQSGGDGVVGVYPPLVDSKWVLGHQEVLARILINGLNGKIIVLGKAYNGNMPAFGPSGLNLKPKQIAGVLTYIRQEWGNQGSDITTDTMKQYMSMYAQRTAPWTAEALMEDLSPEPEVIIPEVIPLEATPVEATSEEAGMEENKALDNHAYDAHTNAMEIPFSDAPKA